MSVDLSSIQCLVPQKDSFTLPQRPQYFVVDHIYAGLAALSHFLLIQNQDHPDIIAAAFWLRKHNLQQLRQQYPGLAQAKIGRALHITPGNVDLLFFYSMIVAVLTAKQSIVRMSQQQPPVTQRLLSQLNTFLQTPEGLILSPWFQVIYYPVNDDLTCYLSEWAEVRLLWGSNDSIAEIQQLTLTQPCKDLCFSDRYSIAVLHCSSHTQTTQIAQLFVQDCQPFLQKGCASPRCVYWVDTPSEIQHDFWKQVNQRLSLTTMSDHDHLQRHYYQQLLALSGNVSTDYQQCITSHTYSITEELIAQHPGTYIFLQQPLAHPSHLQSFSHLQTITYYGIDPSLLQARRVTPLGSALHFNVVWDGIDLIDALL